MDLAIKSCSKRTVHLAIRRIKTSDTQMGRMPPSFLLSAVMVLLLITSLRAGGSSLLKMALTTNVKALRPSPELAMAAR